MEKHSVTFVGLVPFRAMLLIILDSGHLYTKPRWQIKIATVGDAIFLFKDD